MIDIVPATDTDLILILENLHIQVKHASITPKALWTPDNRTVWLRPDLHPIERKCALAHELGHAAGGHTHQTGVLAARQELHADRYAAHLLISAQAYADAERDFGPHTGALAQALEVTRHLVEVWRRYPPNWSSC